MSCFNSPFHDGEMFVYPTLLPNHRNSFVFVTILSMYSTTFYIQITILFYLHMFNLPVHISTIFVFFLTNCQIYRADMLADQYRKKATLYNNSGLVLIPLGDDFRYQSTHEWNVQLDNYNKLIQHINSNPSYRMKVSFLHELLLKIILLFKICIMFTYYLIAQINSSLKLNWLIMFQWYLICLVGFLLKV